MNTKRILSFISALALSVSLWSCSFSDSRAIPDIHEEEHEQVKSGQEVSETSYKLTDYYETVEFKDADLIKGNINGMYPVSDGLFLVSSTDRYYEQEEDVKVLSFDTDILTMEKSSIKDVPNPEPLPEYQWCVQSEEIDKLLEQVPDTNRLTCYAELKTASGDIYLYMSEKYDCPYLLKFDSSGKLVFKTDAIPEITEGYEVIDMLETPEGKILITAYEGIGKTLELSPEDGSVELVYEIPDLTDLYGYSGDKLIYSTVNGNVFGYSYLDNNRTEIYEPDEEHRLYSVKVDNNTVTTFISKKPECRLLTYYTDSEGSIISSSEAQISDESWPHSSCVSPSGELYTLVYTHTIKSDDGEMYEASRYDIYRYSSDGKTEKIVESPFNNFETHISCMDTDANGNILIIRDGEDFGGITEVYSPSGELLYTDTSSDDLRFGRLLKLNGKLLCFSYDEEKYKEISFDGEKTVIKETDIKGIPEIWYFNNIISGNTEGTGYDLYDEDNGSIFGYNSTSGEKTELLSWSDCDVDEIQLAAVIDSENFAVLGWNYDSQDTEEYYDNSHPVFLRKAGEERLAQLNSRKIITAAGSAYNTDYYKYVLKKFNRENNEYFISFKNYETEYDEGTPINGIASDIINGYTPDILLYQPLDDDFQPLVSMNAFADIRELMKDDPEVKYDDIMPNIAEACTYNNKMYMIFPEFHMETYAAKESYAGTEPGWTYSDVMKVLEEHPDMYLPYFLFDIYIKENTDLVNKTCNFDTEDFINLLKIMKNCSDHETARYENMNEGYYEENYGYYPYSELRDDEYIMVYRENATDYIWNMSVYAGETAVLKSLPSSSGKPYLEVSPALCFSVMESSDVKDGAWQFIREFFTENASSEDYRWMYNYSVMKKHTADGDLNVLAKEAEYEGEEYALTVYYGDDEIKVSPPDEKIKKQIRNYMASDVIIASTSQRISKIIYEETEKLWSGETDEKETAESVQRKVMLYLNEIS